MRGQTIAELAASTPEFSTLYAAVEAAGLGETLANPDVNLTVFAPTNQAFAELLLALNIADPADLLSQTDALRSILAYHVIGMPYMLADLTDGEVLPTLLEGYSVTVRETADGVFIVPSGGPAAMVTSEIPVSSLYNCSAKSSLFSNTVFSLSMDHVLQLFAFLLSDRDWGNKLSF